MNIFRVFDYSYRVLELKYSSAPLNSLIRSKMNTIEKGKLLYSEEQNGVTIILFLEISLIMPT